MKQLVAHQDVVARTIKVGPDTYYPGTRVDHSDLSRLPSWRIEELRRAGLVRSA